MEYWQAIILGIIQGITEFLPISSSGHLILLPKIFIWNDQGLAFDAIIHLATGLAIILVLKKEIISLFKKENFNLLKAIVVGILPAGVVGFFLEDLIAGKLRSILVVALSLIIWGIVLYLAELFNNKAKGKKNLQDINCKQGFIIGLCQVIALIPGTSRSGMTIIGGLFTKLEKQVAVKFSFLLGLPLILMAGFYKLFGVVRSGTETEFMNLGLGFVAAFASGILAMNLLLWLAQRASFKVFVVYRIILGLLLLFLFL